jgi:hypothetical protein
MLAEQKVVADVAVSAALADLAMVGACRPACPYGHDIPAAIAAVTGAAHAG